MRMENVWSARSALVNFLFLQLRSVGAPRFTLSPNCPSARSDGAEFQMMGRPTKLHARSTHPTVDTVGMQGTVSKRVLSPLLPQRRTFKFHVRRAPISSRSLNLKKAQLDFPRQEMSATASMDQVTPVQCCRMHQPAVRSELKRALPLNSALVLNGIGT